MTLRRMGPKDFRKDKATMVKEEAQLRIVLKSIGADIRQHREAAGMSLTDLGNLIGWGKDSLSKMERGFFRLSVADYMRIMRVLRDTDPMHPGVLLGDRLLPSIRGRPPAAAAE